MPTLELEFKRQRIIPELFDAYDESKAVDMRVFYPGHKEVTPGIMLKVKETNLGRPHVEVHGPDADLYTLVMTHMDEDPGQTHKEKLLWMVNNIPGSLSPMEDIWARGSESIPYQGALPETGGHHRYVFILLKQNGEAPTKIGPKSRYGFSTRDFLKKHHIDAPVAVTYFLCERDVVDPRAPPPKFDIGIDGINTV
jgi:hypothetical protein